jgi:toxin ParE1/3/4
MARFKFTPKATDDLIQIWNYTCDKWSENRADNYFNMLMDNCRIIAGNADLGKDYSLIAKGLLGFKAGCHIIFYQRAVDRTIEIIRILHEQMDIKRRVTEK